METQQLLRDCVAGPNYAYQSENKALVRVFNESREAPRHRSPAFQINLLRD
jgi:hypothetical protein